MLHAKFAIPSLCADPPPSQPLQLHTQQLHVALSKLSMYSAKLLTSPKF